MNKASIIAFVILWSFGATAFSQSLEHPVIGTSITTTDGKLTMTLINKKQNYDIKDKNIDAEIFSPKSVIIHPNGRKYYVNALEGCMTLCYDMSTHQKIKTIKHFFKEERDVALWSKPSGLFPWTHYTDRPHNTFAGKPVESTFSHHGRYLWVPYYRRSFDINAQDPSAVAIIDTKNDSIIRLMETGPLPKMIATSPDEQIIAISHWGDNTVGLIDISSKKPEDWKYLCKIAVDQQLLLDFPLDESIDRDLHSGYCLRGTVFSPDGNYLFVGCMAQYGGIAVIHVPSRKFLGHIVGMHGNVRHIVLVNNYLYISCNASGVIQRVPLADVIQKAENLKGNTLNLSNWESVHVGTGARTIAFSPDGHYIFSACNTACKIYVVDAEKMLTIGSIDADPYPVGLDVSADGRYVLTTSQGRDKQGGNCVDIYEIQYADGVPEASPLVDFEEEEADTANSQVPPSTPSIRDEKMPFYYAGGAALMIIILLITFRKRKTNK